MAWTPYYNDSNPYYFSNPRVQYSDYLNPVEPDVDYLTSHGAIYKTGGQNPYPQSAYTGGRQYLNQAGLQGLYAPFSTELEADDNYSWMESPEAYQARIAGVNARNARWEDWMATHVPEQENPFGKGNGNMGLLQMFQNMMGGGIGMGEYGFRNMKQGNLPEGYVPETATGWDGS